MKIESVSYLERVKTAEFNSFKELKLSAVIEEGDDALASAALLESMVKSQLFGKAVTNAIPTTTQATTTSKTTNTHSEEAPKVQQESTTSNVSGVSTGDEGSKAIEGAIARAKELGGVEHLGATIEQIKKIAKHLKADFKSKDTKAVLVSTVNAALGFNTVSETTAPPATPTETTLTVTDVQNACRDLAVKFKDPAKVVATLKELGFGAVADIPTDKYGEVIKRLRQVIG